MLTVLFYLVLNLGPCFYWFQVDKDRMQLSSMDKAREYFINNKVTDSHFLCEVRGVENVFKIIR